jgi:hypothetical protein
VNLRVPSSGVKNSKEIMQASTLYGSLFYPDAEVTIFLSNNDQLQPNFLDAVIFIVTGVRTKILKNTPHMRTEQTSVNDT